MATSDLESAFQRLSGMAMGNSFTNAALQSKILNAQPQFVDQQNHRYEFTKWVNQIYPGATAAYGLYGNTEVRFPVGSGFLQTTLTTSIIDSGKLDHVKREVVAFAAINGITLKLESAEEIAEKLEPVKKKRVRMGKWGVSKDWK